MSEEKYVPSPAAVGAILCLTYVLVGMFIYPWWWLEILDERSINQMFRRLMFEYIPLNLIALGVGALACWGWKTLVNKGSVRAVSSRVVNAVKIAYCFLAIAALLSIGAEARAKSVEAEHLDFERLRYWLASERSEGSSLRIEPPVDVVFIDEPRLRSAYEQLLPDLRHTGRVSSTNQSVGIEGGVDLSPVTVSGRGEKASAVTDTYEMPSDQAAETEAIRVFNYLGDNERIVRIAPIETQSAELKALRGAKSEFEKFNVNYNETDFARAEAEVVAANIDNITPSEFRENSWVHIAGDVRVEVLEQQVAFSFAYAKGTSRAVKFECFVPVSQVQPSDAAAFGSPDEWRLNIFGKLIKADRSDGNVYCRLICYLVYR